MGALSGIRVLDLSRVLAGPICTQLLGDLGADILKIEKPFEGDDTRKWGPPFLKDDQGQDTTESAYYLCANRNKKSIAIDISRPEGQKLILKLLEHCDILIENFKVGGLEKYGLDYKSLQQKFPRLIYCAITGFGQSGPLATEPGYDFLAQGMGGLMASTGTPEKGPTKVGVAVSDYVAGLNAAIGILAALNNRTQTGQGQMVDVCLLNSTLAMMTNLAQYTLVSGHNPPQIGNAHTTIVPYQSFEVADGYIIIAIGNDHQFKAFAKCCEKQEWLDRDDFKTNSLRVEHRAKLIPLIEAVLKTKNLNDWLALFRNADVPCGPILPMLDVLKLDQVKAQNMVVPLTHPFCTAPVDFIGAPVKLSQTPAVYKTAPPTRGQHTYNVLTTLLKTPQDQLEILTRDRIIEIP